MDWNEDGNKDLLVGDAYGYIALFLNQGTNHQPDLTGSGFIQVGSNDLNVAGKATPCVNDWNEDGKKDLLIGREDGRVTLMMNEGTNENPIFNIIQFVQANGTDLDVGFSPEDRSAPEVADLDGDGIKDLIIGHQGGSLYYYANSGSNADPIFTISVNLQAGGSILTVGGYSRPDIVDWDEDGDLDLIVGEEQGYVNLYRNSTVNVKNHEFDLVNSPHEFALSQNYPNPFNLVTTIEYQLPHACYMKLTILNLLGQKVKSLVASQSQAGYFKIIWDGTDGSGNYLVSGVYMVALQAGDLLQTRKLLLLK